MFCHVFHHNYILEKGVCPDKTMSEILKIYDKIGAEYPAEHNVGHEYKAKSHLEKFYRELDPTNFFNPGIGKTSKKNKLEISLIYKFLYTSSYFGIIL